MDFSHQGFLVVFVSIIDDYKHFVVCSCSFMLRVRTPHHLFMVVGKVSLKL